MCWLWRALAPFFATSMPSIPTLPPPIITCACPLQVMEELVGRTAKAMVAEGMPYRGVIFAGLMIKNGKVRSRDACYWLQPRRWGHAVSCASAMMQNLP